MIHCNTHYSSWNKMVCLLVFIVSYFLFFSFILGGDCKGGQRVSTKIPGDELE